MILIIQTERWQTIKSLLDFSGFVTISELMNACSSSKSTIHRDIDELENAGLLQRVRGGAISVRKSLTAEPPHSLRSDSNNDEKRRIARAALDFIRPRDTILLDAGTTVCEFAKLLINYNNLMVATNDVITAYNLSFNSNIDLIVVGGLIRHNHHSVVGSFAEQMINNLHADTFFLGADAVDFNHGCMCYSMEEMQIKQAMLHAANTTVLLCDHTKFESVAFVNICHLRDIHTIITGRELGAQYTELIKQHDINLVLV